MKLEPVFDNYRNPKIQYPKGWGTEAWLLNDEENNLCTKIMTVNFKKTCSLHFHRNKNEIFWVAFGSIRFEWIGNDVDPSDFGMVPEQDLQTLDLYKGDSVFIPAGLPHRFLGIFEPVSILVECSTFHKESDSYRIMNGDSQR